VRAVRPPPGPPLTDATIHPVLADHRTSAEHGDGLRPLGARFTRAAALHRHRPSRLHPPPRLTNAHSEQVVLDAGRLVEQGAPAKMLEDHDGWLYRCRGAQARVSLSTEC
jgi:hypothetical protein